VNTVEIVGAHHIFDFSIFYIIEVNSDIGANSVHAAVPDDEMCTRILYLDPIGVLRANVPVLYDVGIVRRSRAGDDPVRGGEASVSVEVDWRACSEAFWSRRTWTNG